MVKRASGALAAREPARWALPLAAGGDEKVSRLMIASSSGERGLWKIVIEITLLEPAAQAGVEAGRAVDFGTVLAAGNANTF